MISSKKNPVIKSNGHELLKEYGRRVLREIYGVPKTLIDENFSYHFDLLINSPTVLFEDVKVIGVACGQLAATTKDTLRKIKDMLNHCQLLIWIPDEVSKLTFYQIADEEIDGISTFAFRILKSDLTFYDLTLEYRNVYCPINFLGVSCLHVTRNV